MRAPRHRFSDHVRTITRSMAASMAEEGALVQSPAELDDWISRRPEVKAPLEADGYGSAFNAADLLPLLEAMAGRPRETAAPPPAPSRMQRPALLAGGALIVAVLLGAIIGLLA